MNSSSSPSGKFPLLWLDDLRLQAESQRTWLCRPFNGKPRLEEWHALLDQLRALHEQVGLDLVVIDPLAPLPAASQAAWPVRAGGFPFLPSVLLVAASGDRPRRGV